MLIHLLVRLAVRSSLNLDCTTVKRLRLRLHRATKKGSNVIFTEKRNTIFLIHFKTHCCQLLPVPRRMCNTLRLSLSVCIPVIVTSRKTTDRIFMKILPKMYFRYVIGRPSVCLSSVTFVHPTQAIEIFGNVSTPCGTLAIRDLCIKIYGDRPRGTPSLGS